MIKYIRAIRSTFFGVVPASSAGCVVGIAGLCAVAVTVRVRWMEKKTTSVPKMINIKIETTNNENDNPWNGQWQNNESLEIYTMF
jgi:hypothetical protein